MRSSLTLAAGDGYKKSAEVTPVARDGRSLHIDGRILREYVSALPGVSLVSEGTPVDRSMVETRIIVRHTYVPAASAQTGLTFLPGGKALDDRPIRERTSRVSMDGIGVDARHRRTHQIPNHQGKLRDAAKTSCLPSTPDRTERHRPLTSVSPERIRALVRIPPAAVSWILVTSVAGALCTEPLPLSAGEAKRRLG